MKLAVSTLLVSVACGSLCAIALACAHDPPAPARAREASTPALASAPTPAPPPAPPPAPAPAPAPAATKAAESCIEVNADFGGKPTTLEGRLVVDAAFSHPSRGPTRPFILRLAASRCAIGIEQPRVLEVHLAPTDSVTLKPLVGQRIRVSGEPFMAHTAWHARPIVVLTKNAVPVDSSL
ncbi:MAG: hypothetical protein KF819_01070 [Labilithrix sp.]|nr:hypothetical protein [Labilithrix sp.]